MECLDCGYVLPPFDKDCPRCKRLGAEVRQKRCPACGKLAPLPAVACEGCGHAYRTQFTEAAPADMPPSPLQPYAVPPPLAPPPSYDPGDPPVPYAAALPAPYPPPVNVFISAPITANTPGRGWQTTLLVLLFATPVGWVVLIGLLFLLLLTLRFALAGLPILAATLAVLAVARLDGSRLDPAKKPALIAGLLALGFAANAALWWVVIGRPERSAPATAGISSPAGTAAPDPSRPHRRLFLRRLFQRQ